MRNLGVYLFVVFFGITVSASDWQKFESQETKDVTIYKTDVCVVSVMKNDDIVIVSSEGTTTEVITFLQGKIIKFWIWRENSVIVTTSGPDLVAKCPLSLLPLPVELQKLGANESNK